MELSHDHGSAGTAPIHEPGGGQIMRRMNRVVVGWRAMSFVTEPDKNGRPQRRPIAQSRIYGSKGAAQDYAEALRVAGFDEPYVQEVERAERKEMGIT